MLKTMRVLSTLPLLATCSLLSSSVFAQSSPLRVDLAASASRFEQQVKTEVGGVRGERLVESVEINLLQSLTYRVGGPVQLGYFLQFDSGKRVAGRFVGFDSQGKTVVADEVGGAFRELWVGPLLRAEWRHLFAELGWGAYGARLDEAREDLPAENGETGLLRTSPRIAWLLALGGSVPLHGALELSLRLEYRVRYYTRRSGEALAGGIVHGTQNFTPLMGLLYRL